MAAGASLSATARPALRLALGILQETGKVLNNLLDESHVARAVHLFPVNKDASLTAAPL
jgi:hypothetical protein